jgi:hypothetical protein
MNHIEHAEDRAGSGFVDELLTAGTCLRLTTLVLWLIDYDEEDDIYQNVYQGAEDIVASVCGHNKYLNKRIISHLFNAPELRKLDFGSFDFQINDFEVIHASLLQLQSLTINEGVIRGDKLPDDVLPTDSLKKLSLVGICINSLSLSNTIRYMIKKIQLLTRMHH